MMRKLLLSSAVGATVLSALPASANGVFVNTLLDSYEYNTVDPEYFAHQGYRAQDIVSSADWLAARGMLGIHDALDLGSADRGARALFMFGAGFLNFRAQVANAIMFGHEQAHWQWHDSIGYTQHSIYNVDDAEEISFGDAYLNTFVYGSPGGSAFSRGGIGATHREHFGPNVAGNNWQMSYSERFLKEALFSDEVLAFQYGSYWANRTKTMTYTIGDIMRGEDLTVQGDMTKVANYYQDHAGLDVSLEKLLLTTAVANFVSPMFWDFFHSSSEYIATGDPYYAPRWRYWNGTPVTWDIPQYLHPDGVTVAPKFYFDISGRDLMGTDRLIVSGGIETAVFESR